MDIDPRMYNLAHNGERVQHEPLITHHTPHTMDRKEFLKQIEETFNSNPNADKFFVTGDAMCFVNEGPARNHSKMLGPHGSGVECITRESIARMKSGKPATGKPGKLPPADNEEKTDEGNGEENTAQEGGELNENGGGAAAGEGTAGTESGQPGGQTAATATKKAAPAKQAAPAKKAAAKKTSKKK